MWYYLSQCLLNWKSLSFVLMKMYQVFKILTEYGLVSDILLRLLGIIEYISLNMVLVLNNWIWWFEKF